MKIDPLKSYEEGKSMTDSHIPASKRTIVVVDDNSDVLEITRILLESEGFNVRCAYSGKDLFAGLEELKPDLILLDIMMPKMNGFEVLRRLKAAPETSSIPVILLSALDQLKDISTCYEMGADHYVTKPFKNAHLMTVIDHLLSGDRPVVREQCLRVVFTGSTTGRRRTDNTIGLRAEYRGGLIRSNVDW